MKIPNTRPASFKKPLKRADEPHNGLDELSGENCPVNILCSNCFSPLNFSALRCPSCGHRHPMASCHSCGEPLFKHASTRVVTKSRPESLVKGYILHHLAKWITQQNHQTISYFHPSCVKANSELIKGAISVLEPDKAYFQFSSSHESHRGKSPEIHHPDQRLALVSGKEQNSPLPVASNVISIHESQSLAPDLNSDESFQSYFNDESIGLPDLLASFQSGKRNFSASQLQGMKLDSHALSGIDLSHSDLRRSFWKNVTLSHADLSHAISDYARFENVDLKGGLFRSMSLRDGKVILSELSKADFYKADLRRSDFYSSRLEKTTLTLANLTEAKLDAADLSLACLVLAKLSRASLTEAKLEGANLKQADCHTANLSWANLKDSVAIKANLTDAILQYSDLDGIDLSEALLFGADFLNSNLQNAHALNGATYNDLTRFPLGFQPEKYGMIKL